MDFSTKLGLRGLNEEEKAQYLTEILEICDNLFYSDYYNKGGQHKTRDQLSDDIKIQVKQDIGDFYGDKNRERVESQIDKHRICFAYQTIGKNSIEDFLNKKQKQYLESKGIDLETYTVLENASSLMLDYRSPEDTLANKEALLQNEVFREALDKLGYTESFLSGDVAKIDEFIHKLFSLNKYSDNNTIDSEMCKLDRYVARYKSNLERERNNKLKEYGITPEVLDYVKNYYEQNKDDPTKREGIFIDAAQEYFNTRYSYEYETAQDDDERWKLIIEKASELKKLTCFEKVWYSEASEIHDPVRQANIEGRVEKTYLDISAGYLNENLFNASSNTEASRDNSYKIVTLGVSASDWVLIHEFLHAVTDGGFQRNHYENKVSEDKAKYSSFMRKNERIDEVVIDYFAKLIYEKRINDGKETIINQVPFTSSYSDLFGSMASFIEREMEDIKMAQMVHEKAPQNTAWAKVSGILRTVLGREKIAQNPADVFASLIGQENFDKIALLCNEMQALCHKENRAELIKMYGEDPEKVQEGVNELSNNMSEELLQLTEQVSAQREEERKEENKGSTRIGDLIDCVRNFPSTIKKAIDTRDRTIDEVKNVMDNPQQKDDGMSM